MYPRRKIRYNTWSKISRSRVVIKSPVTSYITVYDCREISRGDSRCEMISTREKRGRQGFSTLIGVRAVNTIAPKASPGVGVTKAQPGTGTRNICIVKINKK